MRKILKWVGIVGGLLVGLSILLVVALRWMPVYITPLMVGRTVGQIVTGEKVKCVHTWVPIEQMSKSMPLAVVASEDNLFMQHHGFDFTQIELAINEAKRGGRHRGASTISQQTAKNVFLWSGHSYIRKGLEAVAQEHFGKSAKRLTRAEAATIAATLPNPLRYNSAHPSSYVQRRKAKIMSLMSKVEQVDFTK